jgi:hypothetical protein
MGGSLAGVALPALTTATAKYGKANQLTQWNGTNASNDKDNELLIDLLEWIHLFMG